MRLSGTSRLRSLTAIALCALVGVAGCSAQTTSEPVESASSTPAPPSGLDAETMSLIEAADLPKCPRTDDALPNPPADPDMSSTLPTASLACLGNGPAVRLDKLRGMPTAIPVWASWCAPCRDELPIVVEAADEYQGRVRFVGLNLLDDRAAALDMAAAFELNFPSVADPEGVTRGDLRVPGPPITLFVDSNGALVGTHVGQFMSIEQLRESVEMFLGVKP